MCDIEIAVPETTFDGEHADAGGVCRLCQRKLPTSYWCDRNQSTHPGGTICINDVSGRYVDAYEDGGWEYELGSVSWRGGAPLDADERDLFSVEIDNAVVDFLVARW